MTLKQCPPKNLKRTYCLKYNLDRISVAKSKIVIPENDYLRMYMSIVDNFIILSTLGFFVVFHDQQYHKVDRSKLSSLFTNLRLFGHSQIRHMLH